MRKKGDKISYYLKIKPLDLKVNLVLDIEINTDLNLDLEFNEFSNTIKKGK